MIKAFISIVRIVVILCCCMPLLHAAEEMAVSFSFNSAEIYHQGTWQKLKSNNVLTIDLYDTSDKKINLEKYLPYFSYQGKCNFINKDLSEVSEMFPHGAFWEYKAFYLKSSNNRMLLCSDYFPNNLKTFPGIWHIDMQRDDKDSNHGVANIRINCKSCYLLLRNVEFRFYPVTPVPNDWDLFHCHFVSYDDGEVLLSEEPYIEVRSEYGDFFFLVNGQQYNSVDELITNVDVKHYRLLYSSFLITYKDAQKIVNLLRSKGVQVCSFIKKVNSCVGYHFFTIGERTK